MLTGGYQGSGSNDFSIDFDLTQCQRLWHLAVHDLSHQNSVVVFEFFHTTIWSFFAPRQKSFIKAAMDPDDRASVLRAVMCDLY